MKNLFIYSLIMVLTFFSCKSDNSENEKLKKEIKQVESESLSAYSRVTANFETNLGAFTVELYPKQAPKTVKNFVELSERGFYNGISFHRVIKNFMIQGGDPTGTGSGGESIYGGPFEDEFHPDLMHDQPGILSMANAGPGTNTSQFFITVAPTPWLNAKHTIFGRVVEGMEMVNKISEVPTNNLDQPNNPVVINKISIQKIKNN
jgi:cyclophilin family peptidyl-prolyl cis-trans isomerase